MNQSNKPARDEHESRARLIVVEEGLVRVERSVDSLTKSISAYMAEQIRAPRAIPFKEIVVTAGASFAFFLAVLGFMDSRNEMASRDVRFLIAQHEKQLQTLAPLTYSMPKR